MSSTENQTYLSGPAKGFANGLTGLSGEAIRKGMLTRHEAGQASILFGIVALLETVGPIETAALLADLHQVCVERAGEVRPLTNAGRA